MKKIVLPRRALFLWQLRAVLVTFLAAFLLTLLLSDFLFWYRLSLILIGLAFLFFFCVYYPLKRIKFSFFLQSGQLVVDCEMCIRDSLNSYHQSFEENPRYQEYLEMLEYDMLYGKQAVYGGTSGYEPVSYTHLWSA